MFMDDVSNAGAIPMLEKVLAFTEARNRMLAENIANVTTPGYRAKQLDVHGFQSALREAFDKRAAAGGRVDVRSGEQISTDSGGRLRVNPTQEPAENLLFHDGTNARIEREMANLAENAMMHQAATELTRVYFDGLKKAISGRVV
ncbi:MAG: flagellar basal body rod protein FlgB [Phycisphaerae bacterium]|nr:flagellar basal body rod protein FlgB [Phycisphaerae bacterium]